MGKTRLKSFSLCTKLNVFPSISLFTCPCYLLLENIHSLPLRSFTMLRLLSTIALLSLPAIISAQCAACDTYTAALVSCQKTDANVTAVGTVMDTTTLSCMCSTSSTLSDMNACLGCEESSPNVTFDPTILQAWINTCKANAQFGNQQAANCWESQPSDDLPCFSNTPGAGNLGSGTNGGSDVAPTTSRYVCSSFF